MDANSKPSRFALIGAGWRAEFFLRIAQALPERFSAVGALLRDQTKHAPFEAQWGIPAHLTLEALLESKPDFVVLSVPREVVPGFLETLTDLNMPVLCETPPAPKLEDMIGLHKLTERGAQIQIAEQYAFQPIHAARLALAHSGKLGTVHQARVSVAHDYHAISLIRGLLGVGFENATIRAQAFHFNLVVSPDRSGPPQDNKLETQRTILTTFEFEGGRLGVFDFAEWSQYFSWIRSHRVLVQGTHGEITDERLRYLADHRTPVQLDLVRRDAGHGGNLEGYHHQGILAGSEWLYRNPFAPARFSDEEIAIASCLAKMAHYVATGESFYSLAQASQDHYLGLMIHRSLETDSAIKTETQPWAS